MYSNIIVDVFNLYHRIKGHHKEKTLDAITLANEVIDTIEQDLGKYQDRSKSMYLLFDPIPKKDFGLESAFKNSTRRQEILPDYKINRRFNYAQGDLDAINWVRKYFSHRGDKYVEIYSNEFEADDFTESLVQKLLSENKRASIALVTTDNDWARYLGKKVVMLNGPFDKPYTADDFAQQYNFTPTINSVTFFKAFFGDPSDNIQGALMQKRIKKLNYIKKEGFEFIKELSHSDETLDEILERTEKYNLDIIKSDNVEHPAEKKFYFSIIASDFKDNFDPIFYQNIQVIRSQCRDFEKYAKTKEPEEKFNNFIEEVLKRKKPEKQKFKFGKVKI